MRYFLPLALVLALTGCGTLPYQPTEYPLRDGLIAAMPVRGDARIANAQPADGPVIVYAYGGTKLASSLNAITQLMVEQTGRELRKAAQPVEGATAKSLELRVDSLLSRYAGFHWNSELVFEARLGDGRTLRRTVPHTSGILLQDLNGCIAESVMVLLNDPQVRDYLAQ